MIYLFLLLISYSIYAYFSFKSYNLFKVLAKQVIFFDFTTYQSLSNINCRDRGELRPFKYVCNAIRKKFSYDRPKMTSFVHLKMMEFRNSVRDAESLANIDFLEKSILCAVIYRRQYVDFNQYQQNHNQQYHSELGEIKQKYKNNHYLPEVFYFHNGLRFASDKIKQYIKERDILDIGSYNGDSCTVLKDYTNRKIYSYDISQKNIDKYLKHMKLNNIPSDKYEMIRMGISDKVGQIGINSCNNAACSVSSKGNEIINLTTIDIEVKNRNMKVGFIKADVEGVGLDVVKGGIETFKSQKPVVEIAIYHSFEELFGIFDFLKNEIGGYIFEFHSENMNIASAGEIALFAYPSSLI